MGNQFLGIPLLLFVLVLSIQERRFLIVFDMFFYFQAFTVMLLLTTVAMCHVTMVTVSLTTVPLVTIVSVQNGTQDSSVKLTFLHATAPHVKTMPPVGSWRNQRHLSANALRDTEGAIVKLTLIIVWGTSVQTTVSVLTA